MKRVSALLALSLLFVVASARADFFHDYMIDPDDGQLDASRYLSEVPMGFLPVPSIITEPAVGFGLGVGALFFDESKEQRKHRTEEGALLPENISVLMGGGTENGTWGAGVGHLGFWREDSIRYRGFLLYGSINLDFYSLPGVGELPRPIELNLEGPFVFQELLFRLPSTRVFLGARQMYRKVGTEFAGSTNLPALPPAVADYFLEHLQQDISTSGLGGVAEYDSRDNPFNPQQGHFFAGSYMVFDDGIGSDVDYDSFNLSALNYWKLSEKFNLGIRLQYDGVRADEDARLPSYVPPFVDLRGAPKSRYQGNRVVVAEAQLDYKLTPRWKIGIFTGMGRAANHFDDLGSAENVDTYGTGFRYLIAKRYGFSMGIDIARSPDDSAFYIQAGSTW